MCNWGKVNKNVWVRKVYWRKKKRIRLNIERFICSLLIKGLSVEDESIAREIKSTRWRVRPQT